MLSAAGAEIISAGPNDAPDPGETVTVLLALQNSAPAGQCTTPALVGALQTGGAVSSVEVGAQSYGALCGGAAPVWRAFRFKVAPNYACGTPLAFSLVLADGRRPLSTVTYLLTTDALCSAPTLTVTTIDDHDDGECTAADCTLREAVVASNTAPGSVIGFAPSLTGTIELRARLAALNTATTIRGPGAHLLRVRRASTAKYRILNVSPAAVVTVSGLTFSDGQMLGADGGAIRNAGKLTLKDSVVSGSSSVPGVGLGGAGGGGIYNGPGATLTLLRCTVSGNTALGSGGGVLNDGTLSASNCTFSGNTAARGGGLMTRASDGASRTALRNCTISNCTATSISAGTADGGGGFFADGAAQQHEVSNTIIAGNRSIMNPDVAGHFTSGGHNLIGEMTTAVAVGDASNGDQLGYVVAPVDAKLGPLTMNGGSTPTHALLPGSPAIDAGNSLLAPAADQRRYVRISGSDIGAFEANATNAAPDQVQLLGVASRKTHGRAGTFDIPLPLTGNAGVESRSGGVLGRHTLVFTFATPLSAVSGASILTSNGSILTNMIGSDPHEYIVELTGVANAQLITLGLANVSDVFGNSSGSLPVTFGVLLGDSNSDRVINSGDVLQTRIRSGAAANATNFRSDYNLDGTVNSGDTTIVRLRSGQSIP
jgi:CSLREA domain-containing protein